jgi:CYTH domain-containing protein
MASNKVLIVNANQALPIKREWVSLERNEYKYQIKIKLSVLNVIFM